MERRRGESGEARHNSECTHPASGGQTAAKAEALLIGKKPRSQPVRDLRMGLKGGPQKAGNQRVRRTRHRHLGENLGAL